MISGPKSGERVYGASHKRGTRKGRSVLLKKELLGLPVRTFIILEVAPDLVAHIECSCPLIMRPVKDPVGRRDSIGY